MRHLSQLFFSSGNFPPYHYLNGWENFFTIATLLVYSNRFPHHHWVESIWCCCWECYRRESSLSCRMISFLKDYEKGGGVMFIWVCLITIYMVILLLQTASFRINLWAFTLAFYSFISFSRGWCLEGKILCVLRKTLGIFLWKWNKLIYNWIRALINDNSAFL